MPLRKYRERGEGEVKERRETGTALWNKHMCLWKDAGVCWNDQGGERDRGRFSYQIGDSGVIGKAM